MPGRNARISVVHRLDVQAHRELVILLRALQDRAVVDEAGDVDQNVEGGLLLRELASCGIGDVQDLGRQVLFGLEFDQQGGVDVGGEDHCPFACHGDCNGPTDPLRRR